MQTQFKMLTFWRTLAMASWCMLQLMSCTDAQGTWEQLLNNAGISSMHTAITHYNTAILLDRTNIGESEIDLPDGGCRENDDELALKKDCTAHSVMFDTNGNSVRALWVQTDTWCSSGQFDADGKMIQTGGDYEGIKKIRTLAPCGRNGDCDWVETDDELSEGRWYATNQILPDGKMQIVIGGRRAFSYEFVPKRKNNEGVFDLQLLEDTNSESGDNMYPFVHLLPSGNLYIFANRDSIILNYKDDKVEKEFPRIPGEPRNYPSAGSSVMLPLDQADDFSVVEVLVCGGARDGAFKDYREQYPASKTCGRIVVTDDDPEWAMEDMPMRRTMGDMLLLPNGEVLIINGAEKGSQGWGKASDPILTPVKYATYNADNRWQTLAAGDIPRVYHSTANLLVDGRILLAGSNTHQYYTLNGDLPTELRIDAFSPPYLAAGYDDKRPAITDSPATIGYGDTFEITFTATERIGDFEVNIESSPFVTHSYAMGQRLVRLKVTTPVAAANVEGTYTVQVTAPPYAELAPPGYYMLWPVQDWIPGTAVWVKIA
ncbi:hypothetical protein KC19_1G123900 [Ceratodon purpureus]|uniref:Galactose oxidase n=1 Tax=Ceratodon purpureus TaxID=3225 RepID=A0A8T0J7D0_CERPU|nr:hypothetical protein KC19_1G123900 [Ceratodon purpureus]KAG0590753.1 hypothetical protein KC19_1G123900 [Ceratodon purpureus]